MGLENFLQLQGRPQICLIHGLSVFGCWLPILIFFNLRLSLNLWGYLSQKPFQQPLCPFLSFPEVAGRLVKMGFPQIQGRPQIFKIYLLEAGCWLFKFPFFNLWMSLNLWGYLSQKPFQEPLGPFLQFPELLQQIIAGGSRSRVVELLALVDAIPNPPTFLECPRINVQDKVA